MKKLLFAVFLLTCIVLFAQNKEAPEWLDDSVYYENPQKSSREWFKQANFGMFVHLNTGSLCENGKMDYTEWVQGKASDRLLKFVGVTRAEYSNEKDKDQLLYERYLLPNFDADAICSLAKKAEMQYITFTTLHLGGCYNFKTSMTDFNSVNAPVGKDLVAEMAKACKKHGLALFLYVPPKVSETSEEKFETNKTYMRELLTQYGDIAGIWFDGIGSFYSNPDNYKRLSELHAYVRTLQPHALISFKEGAIGTEDFLSPEHFMLPFEYDFKDSLINGRYKIRKDRWKKQNRVRWDGNFENKLREVNTVMQTCLNRDGVGNKSGWINDESAKHFTAEDIYEWLTYSRYTGSNMLMNIGPRGDGSIHPDDERALIEVGKMIRNQGWPPMYNQPDMSKDVILGEPFEPTWESLKNAKPATWWKNGKFGIFIHWGPYSVAGYKDGHKGYAEAITSDMYKKPERYKEFFMEKFGKCPPEFGYKDWVELYTAENWDPQAWAKLFKDAGAKYVIPTGEHHDGFVNWNSELTPWTATKMGPKRDLIGDLADAVRAEGLKYGVSYHRERHPNRFTPKFEVYAEPYNQVAEEIKNDPAAALLYGPFEYSDEFIADYVARWKEVEQKYRPDFMWIDDVPIFYHAEGDPQVIKFQNAFKGMIADYLNNAQKWGKEVYFNNKGKVFNFPEGVGCLERDNLQFDKIGPPWQNPATLGVSYAYMHNEEVNDLYKKPAELIRLLVDIVSKNGNLLLNIGPRADGTIPEGMQKRLLAIGEWLKVNGDAIYDTTPWKVFGESYGKLIEEGGVIYNKHSMRIREQEYRFTAKGKNIYVTSFQPEKQITLKSFINYDTKIKSIKTMTGKKLKWKKSEDGLTIYNKNVDDFDVASVYVIETK